MTDFDPLVLRAMQRWPDVPAVFGWLRLDRRGTWYLIDRGQSGFDEERDGAGSPITSPQIIAFIGRNYASDPKGRWFWQNGPQRVYVSLDCSPWVLRVLGRGRDARLITHTGLDFGVPDRAAIGPNEELLLCSALGCGVVHDLDAMALGLEALPDGRTGLFLAEQSLDLPACANPECSFDFVRHPRA
jgi:hypothetical protein